MLLISCLITGLAIVIIFSRDINAKSFFYTLLASILYGVMALMIAFWSYSLAIVLALLNCKRFNSIFAYSLFGAFLGALMGALWTLFFVIIGAKFDIFFILLGAFIGFFTLLIDGKIYKGKR